MKKSIISLLVVLIASVSFAGEVKKTDSVPVVKTPIVQKQVSSVKKVKKVKVKDVIKPAYVAPITKKKDAHASVPTPVKEDVKK